VIGPFPNKKRADGSRAGMDSIYPPEAAIDRNQVYPGLYGKPLRWQILKTPADGFVSFDKMIRADEPAVFYALTYIYSPEDRTATLLIGSDDAIKVYYNYSKVLSLKGDRTIDPDQGRSFIKLNKGWNKLLLKIENMAGKFGFYARILDRENIFRYDVSQTLRAEASAPQVKQIKRK
jgi:hypothetical protein